MEAGEQTVSPTMTVITSMEVVDWRYPTSLQGDGSDAVHKDPDVRLSFHAVLHAAPDTAPPAPAGPRANTARRRGSTRAST